MHDPTFRDWLDSRLATVVAPLAAVAVMVVMYAMGPQASVPANPAATASEQRIPPQDRALCDDGFDSRVALR